MVCELTGEDIFLDAMEEADRKRLREIIRSRAGDVTRFISTTKYYAGQMAAYLGIGMIELRSCRQDWRRNISHL